MGQVINFDFYRLMRETNGKNEHRQENKNTRRKKDSFLDRATRATNLLRARLLGIRCINNPFYGKDLEFVENKIEEERTLKAIKKTKLKLLISTTLCSFGILGGFFLHDLTNNLKGDTRFLSLYFLYSLTVILSLYGVIRYKNKLMELEKNFYIGDRKKNFNEQEDNDPLVG
jgi:uncharacterized membrane protein YidH (DUF202 family)